MKVRALIGYDPQKVGRYFNALEEEEASLDRQRMQLEQTHKLMEAELEHEIDELKRKVAELDQIETNLKQWLQINRN
ncbi:hypothetical protein [Paenibacillus piri]|uniref:Uncharacterized protein n=1 Tax=Paenibacillus piri TaxID=2547395 RepID=A0A4R5KNZ3_9BACL|nr:hypothetical protein [Paenibacillus piri]TDF96330.1 hypothetical protein E1757_18290 [Paenibacillus piri]